MEENIGVDLSDSPIVNREKFEVSDLGINSIKFYNEKSSNCNFTAIV